MSLSFALGLSFDMSYRNFDLSSYSISQIPLLPHLNYLFLMFHDSLSIISAFSILPFTFTSRFLRETSFSFYALEIHASNSNSIQVKNWPFSIFSLEGRCSSWSIIELFILWSVHFYSLTPFFIIISLLNFSVFFFK